MDRNNSEDEPVLTCFYFAVFLLCSCGVPPVIQLNHQIPQIPDKEYNWSIMGLLLTPGLDCD